MKTALVLGAGGFIGSHLVKRLKSEGYWVRGVDLKYPEFSDTEADEFLTYDLRKHDNVQAVMRITKLKSFTYMPDPFDDNRPFDEVYQLAADMGGAGFVFTGDNDADIMLNSVLINLNVINNASTEKIFYSSSACVYPAYAQDNPMNLGLKEEDAYPADPDSEYGWEKLFSERLYMSYARNKGIDVRIGRFHNIYGPESTYEGGREKAPAAICRKVIKPESDPTPGNYPKSIQVWGDGEQTRSFLYIDDCLDAVRKLMDSEYLKPINIGSEESISINRLAQMVINISGKDLMIKNIEGPVGVQGRNSDNELIRKVLGWQPKVSLNDGMYRLYKWIENEIKTTI